MRTAAFNARKTSGGVGGGRNVRLVARPRVQSSRASACDGERFAKICIPFPFLDISGTVVVYDCAVSARVRISCEGSEALLIGVVHEVGDTTQHCLMWDGDTQTGTAHAGSAVLLMMASTFPLKRTALTFMNDQV